MLSVSKFSVVTREAHAMKRWRAAGDYQFASEMAVAPIVVAELAQASHAIPLALVKDGEQFVLTALLSLLPNQNLFVGPQGQWLGTYVPALVRSYPFRMLRQG